VKTKIVLFTVNSRLGGFLRTLVMQLENGCGRTSIF
jgi:hypothetical protein